ncbi:MAG: MipA/OmpV family protein [Rhodocyclales bacterium]|nr:MipA/OmpV family protein [Rhodocyclales bacterium]MBI5784582.1 MipA/OmpV family protein [Rhodocyclales bacterium]
MTSKYLRPIAALAALVPGLVLAGGQEKPLWEIGVGVAALSFPAYRGSENRYNFLMPTPYFVYHGEFLKADRHGLRGSLFDSDRAELTLSLSASPPTSSDDAPVRNGMPDLKPTVEFGPQLELTLWRTETRARFVKLRLPLRAAITVEGSPRSAGWIFAPDLNMDIGDLPGMPGWNLGMVAGPIWATKRQHDFFYTVAPAYATATRPAYEARGGYSGAKFLVALSKRFERTWFGVFVRYDALSGATFEDSPLTTKKNFVAAGLGISWVLDESKTRVWVDD